MRLSNLELCWIAWARGPEQDEQAVDQRLEGSRKPLAPLQQ